MQESWLYHLSVAAGAAVSKVGTEFEQLVGKLFQLDGDPGKDFLQIPFLFVGVFDLWVSLTA